MVRHVERGLSLNKQLVVENMSEISLIAQRFVEDHMLLSDYHHHDMLIAKELVRSVRNSNAAYKDTLKQKRESEKKAEEDQRLASVEEKMSYLNSKKLSLEEATKEYHVEADKYAYDAEKKENLELLKLSNGLKRSAEKKQAELGTVLEKRKCFEENKRHVK